jgi:choline dehydrogenase-like flavoprotein
MGADPQSSVVGADLRVHGIADLYVMDGSVLPSSPAVNPQLTIMALASRAAQRLAERL